MDAGPLEAGARLDRVLVAHWPTWSRTRVVPHDDAALRPAEGFPAGAGHDRGAFGERILELPSANQAQLVGAVRPPEGAMMSATYRTGR